MTLYIAGLPEDSTDSLVHDLCSEFGKVSAVRIPPPKTDRKTRTRIAFVDMPDADAQRAIAGLHGQTKLGHKIACKEARPRKEREAYAGRR